MKQLFYFKAKKQYVKTMASLGYLKSQAHIICKITIPLRNRDALLNVAHVQRNKAFLKVISQDQTKVLVPLRR